MNQVRVLVVTTKAEAGGAERWLLSVLDRRPDLLPTVVLTDAGPLAGSVADRGWPLLVRPTGKRPGDMLRTARWLHAVVEQTTPDVILLNSAKAGVLAAAAARIRSVPCVYVRHGAAFARTAAIVARTASATIAVSTDLADGLTGAATTVIQPARPPLSSRAEPAGPPLLVMLCRADPDKGVDTAVRALARAPRWQLAVAGDFPADHPERRRLEVLTDDLGLAERVRFVGPVPSADVVLRGAWAAAVLTRPLPGQPGPAEGFGLVVVEAAAMGVPVIADPAQVPSVSSLGGAGVVPVPHDDPGAVAAALDRLLDAQVRTSLGDAGRTAVAALPDEQQVADAVAAVLRGVVAGAGTPATSGV